MQIQTIRFSANEQNLTGGGSLFASSTVSYIRALFDLGENWTGWTVRAIWKSRGEQISTVLEDGACMVPAEVLANPGQVYVNLVASETENNVIVERLTTYPVLALVVDARALVDGTETAEITPSQFEQFVNAVEDYSEQAISARDRAETAADNAERDAGIASGAKTDAETAQRKAEAAQGFAEEAATAAGNSAADADRSEGEAAAWATGSYSGDGGIPVPPTAPQHHNNAKYYSEQAEAALEQFTTPTASASTLPAGSSATASYSDGNFALGIPKGDKGDTGNPGATGPAAGFGEVSATVDGGVGTPSVEVSASGPDTAKEFAFAFHNLKGEQGEQGDPGEVTNEDLWDILPTDSASGAIASFGDGAKNVPLKSLVVDIDPVQDLHGYANPWPSGGGKNLLNPGANETIFGITKTVNADGTIRFNGTATGVADFYFNGTTVTGTTLDIPDGTYRLYGTEQGSTSTYRIFMIYIKNGQTYYANGGDHTAIEWDNTTIGRLFLRVYSGATIDVTLKLSFVSGTQDAWTPYSNICPISGHTGSNVTAAGNNLLKPTVYKGVAYNPTIGATFDTELSAAQFTDNHDGTFTVTTSATWKYFCLLFPLKSGVNYWGQFKFQSTGQGGVTRGYLDNEYKVLSKTNSTDATQTFNGQLSNHEGSAYYYLVFTNRGTASATLTITEPMISVGTAARTYEPCNATTKAVTWQDSAGTVYGGTVDVGRGIVTTNKVLITLRQTGPWISSSSYPGGHFMSWGNVATEYGTPPLKTNTPFLCTHAKTVTSLSDYTFGTCYSDSACNIRIMPTSSATNWKQYLEDQYTAGTPVQICAELVTPIEYTLTPEQVVTLLGQNNILADTGDVEVEYRADTKLYINKIVAALA